MKMMVIGATGTIGRAVVEKLSARHTVIKVGTQAVMFGWISSMIISCIEM